MLKPDRVVVTRLCCYRLLMTLCPPFRDRVVRDLWWAVTSPGLVVENDCAVVAPFDPATLQSAFVALDGDPQPLHLAVAGSLAGDRLRLGAYFEDLIHFFVTQVEGHRDTVSGVVIRDKKRTVGELDLLFRDGVSCHHWELAVKFFLQVPGLAPDPGDCFVGPQTRDRLHMKIARVRDHQVPLSKHPAAARVLAPWQPLRSAALLRGRLFYPASSDWAAGAGGDAVAVNHLRGWWCPVERCHEQLPEADSYALLTRRDWLAPVDAELDGVTRWDRGQVCAWATEAGATWPTGVARSHVVAGLDSDGRELHRGFLVSIGWPGRGVSGGAES